MDNIQNEMLQKARDAFNKNIKEADDWKTFMQHLNNSSIVLTPWLLPNKFISPR